MKLTVAAVGRMSSGPESMLWGIYAERTARMGRSLGFSGPDLREIDHGKPSDAAARKSREADAFLAGLPDAGRVILLDETGKQQPSEDFARMLGGWNDDGVRECQFWIGGADGHGDAARARADSIMSFGVMTWPHMLVRAMLGEQIYRAMTILSNHPYHRA